MHTNWPGVYKICIYSESFGTGLMFAGFNYIDGDWGLKLVLHFINELNTTMWISSSNDSFSMICKYSCVNVKI